MSYSPGTVPSNPADLPGFLRQELLRISNELTNVLTLPTLYAAPSRIYEGQIVKADGTSWDPGGGAGIYARVGGAWIGPFGTGGGGGGGNSVTASVNFGGSFTDKAQTVVTGQTWVTANSEIVAQVLTPTGADTDEMYLLGMRAEISDLVPGTGFTVTVYSETEAKGTYSVMCVGV